MVMWLHSTHQLRGRIGCGTDQAYAYFLYRPKNALSVSGDAAHSGAFSPKHITQNATERLEALRAYADLGSGYKIALRDLKIRGAGNILGREQSGAVNKVGLNLYYQMLGEAIEEIKGTIV